MNGLEVNLMKKNPYPHVFQPITIRGLTLKNRLEYAPTVVDVYKRQT